MTVRDVFLWFYYVLWFAVLVFIGYLTYEAMRLGL